MAAFDRDVAFGDRASVIVFSYAAAAASNLAGKSIDPPPPFVELR